MERPLVLRSVTFLPMPMQDESLNLVPRERVQAFRQEYFLRLFTVILLAGMCVVIAHGLLLVPSYIYEQIVIAKQTEHLAQLSAQPIRTGQEETSQQLKTLASDAAYLTRLQATATVSDAIRAILAVPRPGVVLTGIVFGLSTEDGFPQIVLSGSATTRDVLRQYALALSHTPGIQSAVVPISAYAEEKNINFTLTLKGTFLPLP